jgi:hypothetical protein
MEKERKNNKRVVWDGHIYDLPSDLGAAIAFLQEQMEKIPAEARPDACLDINDTDVEIRFWAPETDDELVGRLKVQAQRRRIAEETEREQFKRLQEKYGEKT